MEKSDPFESPPTVSTSRRDIVGAHPHTQSDRSVVVFDSHNDRCRAVCSILSGLGAQPLTVGRFLDLRSLNFSRAYAIATVALGKLPPSENPDLEIVRELTRKGFKVVCYEDETVLWSLAHRCCALLAGAECLLDSAAEGFSSELGRHIGRLLDGESRRQQEDLRTRKIMSDLGLVGESQAMTSLFGWVLRVSMLSDVPALIMGETGTGKELVASAIHRLDPKRRQSPLVAVNCGALGRELAESELFGYRRGSFTGAIQDRKGLFRAAEGGILLLDEISEMEGPVQTKLLRVLQEGRVLGLGEDREVPVNVRVLAASNRPLEPLVSQGRFRDDLYHRLNVISIRIPPLRERAEDIRPLIDHFLKKHMRLCRPGSVSASPEFIQALTHVKFPGNVRELENLVRGALARKETDAPLALADLSSEIWSQLAEDGQSRPAGWDAPQSRGIPEDRLGAAFREEPPSGILGVLEMNEWSLSRSLNHCEKIFLGAALRRENGNQTHTARLLGISPRSVYSKVRKHHLTS